MINLTAQTRALWKDLHYNLFRQAGDKLPGVYRSLVVLGSSILTGGWDSVKWAGLWNQSVPK